MADSVPPAQSSSAPLSEPRTTEVSSTRLYLGNLARNATRANVEEYFKQHGTGEIVEIKLMNGFGFIEYKDPMDARDVVPAFHGTEFLGERLIVQFARGTRRNENFAHHERAAPRPRRTPYRMRISGLPVETSWQDLKDFARQSGLDVVYSEVGRDRDGTGFVEYETAGDLQIAVEKLDGQTFKNQNVRCIQDVSSPPPALQYRPRVPYGAGPPPDDRRGDRYRSRSPAGRRGYPPAPYDDYYDRRGPPRGYSPRRDDYRRRTPPPPRDYYERDRYGRPPSRTGRPVMEEYGPPRPRYPEDPYDAPRGVPPRRGYEPDPYVNGHARPYDHARAPSPRGRARSPVVPRPYEEGYPPRGRYWYATPFVANYQEILTHMDRSLRLHHEGVDDVESTEY